MLVIADVLTMELAESTTKVLAMWTKLTRSCTAVCNDSRLLLHR